MLLMLQIKAPQAAIMYLETSAQHWKIDAEKKKSRTPPYRTDMEGHLAILKYYDIMQLDMMRMLGPIGTMLRTCLFRHYIDMRSCVQQQLANHSQA
jgi:hypothetical protein